MTMLELPNGYYELPRGKLVNAVTCLEMRAKPAFVPTPLPEGCHLEKFNRHDLAKFRNLFLRIGADLLWFSRLIMPDHELAEILSDPNIESYALMQENTAVGLLELNFAQDGQCELAFFGLAPETVGRGLGKALMSEAIERAWQKPISRFWLHTCHYDHPRALSFYQTAGFKPYRLMIEVHDDPRLSGHLPRSSGPQVALLD